MPAQNQLATLSTDSVNRVIAGATHEGLVGEKKYVLTSQAILDVVSSVRSQRPLGQVIRERSRASLGGVLS